MAVKIKRNPKVLSADFKDGTVILDLKTRLPYILNSIAREIWLLLSRPRDKLEIVNSLSKKYRLAARRINKDLGVLLAEMRKKGLVEYVAKR